MAELSTSVKDSMNSRTARPNNEVTEPKSLYVTTDSSTTSTGINNMLCEHTVTPESVNQSYSINLKIVSPAASSGPFCRICHEGDATEDLVSICKCTGTVGLVHVTCLERWLSSRRNATSVDQCEICNHTFETIRYPKSLTEWYQSEQGPTAARHSILGDIACFSLITPLAVVSTFLCIQGAKRHVMWNNSLEAGCLMAVATFLITVYLVWNILTVRYHLRSYYKWSLSNQNVRLVRYRRTSTSAENYPEIDVERNTQSLETRPETSIHNQTASLEEDHSLQHANFAGSFISHMRWILV